MFCYEDFKKLPVDHSVIGLIQRESYEHYFCTLEQAEIIGGADGPVAVFVGAKTPKLHAAASSLHFAPPKEVQWQAVFSEKRLEDITVELNPTSQEE